MNNKLKLWDIMLFIKKKLTGKIVCLAFKDDKFTSNKN